MSERWVVQAALLVEGGRQCMIWPEHGGLSAHGEDFVIDPYSRGALYSQAEASAASSCQLPCQSHMPSNHEMSGTSTLDGVT